MKTTLSFIIGLATLSVVAQNQNGFPADPLPPPAPEPPGGVSAAPTATTRPTKIRRVEVQTSSKSGVAAQGATIDEGANGGGGGGRQAGLAFSRNGRTVEADISLPRSTKTGRTLVIQTSNPDPHLVANTEEDLSVMALILRKATGGSRGEDKRIALGIEVDSSVFGSSSGARNIYLEGYGALFLLGVRFPLVAPDDQAEEINDKEVADSDWAEAREEFLNEGRSRFEEQFQQVFKNVGRSAPEEYNADKVEELKTSLLSSLKNATNIRALQPDNYVTVVIQGAEAVRADKPDNRRAGKRSTNSRRSDSDRNETVMTMRVKKSDVDAFAKGSLDLDEFRKKTSFQTYLRRGDSSVATSLFLPTLRVQ
jgi:hypothetical protein